jgi:salicylate hydroxylase
VALLGDAAHPTLQYLAQGACMAIEDGVVLGDALARTNGEVEPALLAYRDRRVLRTARVQLMSRAIGDHIYHPSGPHAALRNQLMGRGSQEQWWDTLSWLYDGAGQEEAAPVDGPPADH